MSADKDKLDQKSGGCTISVIMPAYNASSLLPEVLKPLIQLKEAGKVSEVIVVDDQSQDETAKLAREMGADVLVTPQNGGPGAARNFAAEKAVGDVLWFVDSDVIAFAVGADRLSDAFSDPGLGAVFGSYDDSPGSDGWFSKYKNLLHHYHHQQGRRDATTFWAGCGAVRASVFHAVGGFDIHTYEVPSIEDIELGYRISDAGHRIEIDPGLLCKHLKHWTIINAVHTDIFRRALPWARLMIERNTVTNDLNASNAERARAVLAAVFFVSLLFLIVQPGTWPFAFGMTILIFAANWRLFRLFRRAGGLPMAVASMVYHQFYYVYSAGVFVWCLFEFHVLGKKDRVGVYK
ncbi:MAG: glycosyltransferase family 2 protein [Silicimonas sp.]|nr:glycosyltransferase family 2 protein [Silicimonas sp.]